MSTSGSIVPIVKLRSILRIRLRRTTLTREHAFSVLSPLLVLVAWQVVSSAGLLDERIYSSPIGVMKTGRQLVQDGVLLDSTGVTLLRFAGGTLLGLVPGLFIGLIMGLSRTWRAVLNPLVSIIYPLPHVALFPLVLLTIGVTEKANLVMIAIGPFFTMLLVTMTAVQNVDPIYLKVARSYHTSRRDLYTKVLLPASMPHVLGGAKMAVAIGLVGVVAVEFLTAQDGIGYLIWRSWQVLSLGQSMVGLVVVGVIGLIFFRALDALERRLVPWNTSR